jgi:cytochrome c biogenesis protein ResB
MNTRLQPDQTIIAFDKYLHFGFKLAHWIPHLKLDQVLVGYFCKFFADSLVFLFLSKVSCIMEGREYYSTSQSTLIQVIQINVES